MFKKTFFCKTPLVAAASDKFVRLAKMIKSVRTGIFFFIYWFYFTENDDSQGRRDQLNCPLPLPPANEHAKIFLKDRIWDDYLIYLIAVRGSHLRWKTPDKCRNFRKRVEVVKRNRDGSLLSSVSMMNNVLETIAVLTYLFHDGGLYHTETSSLIWSANQWTKLYIIGTSVMKGLSFSNLIKS